MCEPTEEPAIRSGDHQFGQRRFDARHPVGTNLLTEDEESHDTEEDEDVHLRLR